MSTGVNADPWASLATTALLGTDRRLPDAAAWPGALGAAVEGAGSAVQIGSDGDSPGAPGLADPGSPAGVLDVAALATVYRAAGMPVTTAVPGPVGPASTCPLPSARAAARLKDLIANRELELLTEWLHAAVGRGYRVPDELLPEVLTFCMDKARGYSSIGAKIPRLVNQMLDERGHWIANQRPEWVIAADADHKALVAGVDLGDPQTNPVWLHGTAAQRVNFLTAYRAVDPDGARALLEGVWRSEDAKSREALIASLRTNTSPLDEELLNSARMDRSRKVRNAAADLLELIPSSQFVTRMIERVASWITVANAGGRVQLEIQLPEELDAADKADGLADAENSVIKDSKNPTRIASEWFDRAAKRIPLSQWREWGIPQDLATLDVRLAQHSPHMVVYQHIDVWAHATLRESNVEWARELLKLIIEKPKLRAYLRLSATTGLVRLLPHDEAENLVTDLVTVVCRNKDDEVGRLYQDLEDFLGLLDVWPERIVSLLLDWLCALDPKSRYTRPEVVINMLGHRAQPEIAVLESLSAAIDQLPVSSFIENQLVKAHTLLSIRQTMFEELQ